MTIVAWLRAVSLGTPLATALACGPADSASGAPSCAASASGVDASGATASANDVEKILARSCSLGGCHAGSPGAGNLTLPLASREWVANVVDRPSREYPAMMLVLRGVPDKSWMVKKLTGDSCLFGRDCEPPVGCGQRMPFGQALSNDEIATIVNWVSGGAN